MPKVVFFTSLAPETARLLTQYAPSDFDVSVHPITLPDEEKISLIQDADFLILFPGIISEQVLRSAGHLKLIQLVSAGFDRLNLDLCRELGIPVANNGGANSIDVAEHTVALILGFYRHLTQQDRNIRSNRWGEIDTGLTTYTINGKTVGIVGLGNIGKGVAHLLKAFGAQLLYYDESRLSPEMEKDLGVTRVELEELLRSSDIITLHMPLTPQTHNFLGKGELDLMKPSALLVNTCRGPVVDEEALIEVLQEGRILGAALDVLQNEPPKSENPLLKLDNVLLTPHIAGVTYDTWARRGKFIFHNLEQVWRGGLANGLVS